MTLNWHIVEKHEGIFAIPKAYPHLRLKITSDYYRGAACGSELRLFHPERGWTSLGHTVLNWNMFRWNTTLTVHNKWQLTEVESHQWQEWLPNETSAERKEREKLLKDAAQMEAHHRMKILAEELYASVV